MSEWYVRVVNTQNNSKHENADSLSIVMVDGGYPCIVRTEDIKPLMTYVPVDSLCPIDKPEFAFLDKPRIKAKRLRGVFSMGLLIPIKPGMKEGQIVDKEYGITKWEPAIDQAERKEKRQLLGGENMPDPGFIPEYTDIESIRKHKNILEEGEEVILSEKCHGANARYCYSNNKFWVASHYKFKKQPREATKFELFIAFVLTALYTIVHPIFRKRSVWINKLAYILKKPIPLTNWWKVAISENLEDKLKQFPDYAFYGEVFGDVQDLKYGAKQGEIKIRFFDIMNTKTREYLDYDDFIKIINNAKLEAMPILYRGPWNFEKLATLSNGKSIIPGADNIREGFVVKPVKERRHSHCGRVIFKFVGENYLLRKEK